MLKTDLHLHTKEDPSDYWFIKYSAKDLIRFMAKKGFDVISITNHNQVFFNKEIKEYAKKKNILLIPGCEISINKKHVLLHNVSEKNIKKIRSLSDLEKIKNNNGMVTAPHPFFMTKNCLGQDMIKNIDLFDAVEYSHFYTRFFNCNKKAVKISQEFQKPVIGNSDAHLLDTVETTYSLIDADKNIDSVLEAIRHNRIKVKTKPLSYQYAFRVVFNRFFIEPFAKPRK